MKRDPLQQKVLLVVAAGDSKGFILIATGTVGVRVSACENEHVCVCEGDAKKKLHIPKPG